MDPSEEDSTYMRSGDTIAWASMELIAVKVNENLPDGFEIIHVAVEKSISERIDDRERLVQVKKRLVRSCSSSVNETNEMNEDSLTKEKIT